MPSKNINELKEGMVIEKNVVGRGGGILFPQKTILDKEDIETLKFNGIQSVEIADNVDFINKFKEIDERVDKKFQVFADQPIMQHIAILAKSYLKSKVKSG